MLPLWLALVGCQSSEYPAPIIGSSYRIEEDNPDPESELIIDILTTEAECRKAKIDELEICRPAVDRSAAEVQLSFMFRDRIAEQPFPISLTTDQLMVMHDRVRQEDIELIPHKPRSSGQLYVVVIDGSGSMYENGGERIEKVRKALKSKEVVDAFFPSPDAKTGVLLMYFNDELHTLDGGAPKVIRSKKEYRRVIRENINTRHGGYTHLYGAIRQGMTKLLVQKRVKRFLETVVAQPTFIVLTDGFNNEAASDTCGTNVDRLRKTIDVVRKARGSGSNRTPVLYTVGLGERYRNGEKPEGINARVTPSALCGRYVEERIDGRLERFGIDHISLAWLAEAGGGASFVKRSPKGLAEVFVQAAAKRYEWFEINYRVADSLYHRKSFNVELRMQRGYRSKTKVKILPNPWLDAPTGAPPEGGRWTQTTPIAHSLAVLMPILGLLVFLNFLGAATFNARRAIFRRAKPRDRN